MFVFLNLFLTVGAQAESFDELFKAGVRFFQEEKFEEAKITFQKAVQIEKNNVSALINLAFSEYKLGHRGVALGYLRRAQYWQPNSTEAIQLYEKIYSEMPVKQIPHRHSFYEGIQSAVLSKISLQSLLLVIFLMFMGGGLGLIQFFYRKRSFQKAVETLEEGSSMNLQAPTFSWITGVMFLGFVLISVLGALKVYDLETPKGTVIEEKVSVKTAPSEEESEVMMLFEGLEVEVLSRKAGWLQVYYPGSYAGWVPEKSLLILSDR